MQSFLKILMILMLLSLSFCQTTYDPLPKVYVDITLDLDKPEFYELNTLGNYVYITGGVAGIIVYRDLTGEFKAYERACPYDYNENGAYVSVVDIGLAVAQDTISCGTKYSLSNEGVVLEGPGQLPLRQYKTYYNPNTNELRIVSY